jgi:hypothetical protein
MVAATVRIEGFAGTSISSSFTDLARISDDGLTGSPT